MSLDELPIFVGCFSLVKEYVKTFYVLGSECPVNKLVFGNIKYNLEGYSYLTFPDSVFHAATTANLGSRLMGDTLWGATRIEPVMEYGITESVIKLASLKSIEKRPQFICTLDPEMRAKAKKTNLKAITPEEALKKIADFESKYGFPPKKS